MKYYSAVASILFLFISINYSNNKHNSVSMDSQKKVLFVNDSINNNDQSKVYSLKDTIALFIKENLYYSSIINLSFCQEELVKILNNDNNYRNEWRKKMKNYFTMYNEPIDYISAGKEFMFFKKRLLEKTMLQKEYPKGYNFLIKSLPANLDTLFTSHKYQELFLRFRNADGGNVDELTDLYYTFFITDGLMFVKSIEENSKCVILFQKWIKNIEESEFTAFGSDNLPPQIIERKRNYLIKKYSSADDPLIREAIIKIKIAKINFIN